jgi:hypothetical protein
MNTATDLEYAAFVGIDWTDRKHDVCLQAAGSSEHEFFVLAHRPESIAQWAQALRQRFGGRPIAVSSHDVLSPLLLHQARRPNVKDHGRAGTQLTKLDDAVRRVPCIAGFGGPASTVHFVIEQLVPLFQPQWAFFVLARVLYSVSTSLGAMTPSTAHESHYSHTDEHKGRRFWNRCGVEFNNRSIWLERGIHMRGTLVWGIVPQPTDTVYSISKLPIDRRVVLARRCGNGTMRVVWLSWSPVRISN